MGIGECGTGVKNAPGADGGIVQVASGDLLLPQEYPEIFCCPLFLILHPPTSCSIRVWEFYAAPLFTAVLS